MPGRLFLTMPVAEIAALAGVSPEAVADARPRHNIEPGQEVVALSPDGLVWMRWGMIPVGRVNARGRPVMETIINARSETVFGKQAFSGAGRAVLPVNGWYEWTGKARRKTAWRIVPKDGGILWFAAISDVWTAPGGKVLHQLATLTCAPSADVQDIHHRMGVILDPSDISRWLSGGEDDVRALMRPWPDGRLSVSVASDVDWTAP